MQFHKFRSSALGFVLAMSGLSSAQASTLVTFVSSPATASFGTLSPDGTSSSISGDGPGYSTRAQALIGVNKVYAFADLAENGSVRAEALWSVNFNLLGVARGTIVPIVINVDYDFSIESERQGIANFVLNLNGEADVLIARTLTTGFGGDACPQVPGSRPRGECAGPHAGTVSRTVEYSARPNLTLSLRAIALLGLAGTTDAFNTARVTSIVIPDGVIFEYVDLAGNPLNVMNASQAAADSVPEPGTLGMLGAGIAAVFIAKAKQAKKS